jgi:alpha-beta hydrolase superfamily lysophospholipase
MRKFSPIENKENRLIETGFFPSQYGKESIYFKHSFPKNVDTDSDVELLIVHDACEYHARHFYLPEFLDGRLQGNIIFTWYDLKGHGLSSGSRGHIEIIDEYVDDLKEMILNSQTRKKGKKIVLLGHGLGATLIFRLFKKYESEVDLLVDGCIFSNPYIRFKVEVPPVIRLLMKSLPEAVGRIRLPHSFSGQEVTKDQKERDLFNGDPLINHHITINLFREIFKLSHSIRSTSYFFDCKSLFLLGDKDPYTEPDKTVLFLKGMPKNKVRYKKYPEMGHDLFNEVGRDKLFEDVYNWINKEILG